MTWRGVTGSARVMGLVWLIGTTGAAVATDGVGVPGEPPGEPTSSVFTIELAENYLLVGQMSGGEPLDGPLVVEDAWIIDQGLVTDLIIVEEAPDPRSALTGSAPANPWATFELLVLAPDLIFVRSASGWWRGTKGGPYPELFSVFLADEAGEWMLQSAMSVQAAVEVFIPWPEEGEEWPPVDRTMVPNGGVFSQPPCPKPDPGEDGEVFILHISDDGDGDPTNDVYLIIVWFPDDFPVIELRSGDLCIDLGILPDGWVGRGPTGIFIDPQPTLPLIPVGREDMDFIPIER